MWGFGSTAPIIPIFYSSWDVSDLTHAVVTSSRGFEPQVPTEYKAGWAS